MRIGINWNFEFKNTEEWINQMKDMNVSSVVAPFVHNETKEVKAAYLNAARDNDLRISEVWAWGNVLSPNEDERNTAIMHAKRQLALAEEIGAECAINISGARGAKWDGYYPDNYSDETYDMIIKTTRGIIDAVEPKKTFYTIEPMPWMVPDSPDHYIKLLHDVDREAFGIHIDYTNMVNSMEKYMNRNAFISECFEKLGPYAKGIHIKDIQLDHSVLPCSITETLPGEGSIDYAHVLRQIEKLEQQYGEKTFLIEHLHTYDEYKDAVSYVRQIAMENNIMIK
jgi:sugar phosphate isomerase/epimerase